jgi:hypothetical protein
MRDEREAGRGCIGNVRHDFERPAGPSISARRVDLGVK